MSSVPRIAVLVCAALAACGPENRTEDVAPSPKPGVLERIVEAGVDGAVAVPHHRTVRSGVDGLRLDDPRSASTALASVGSVRAAALAPDGGLLVATDDDLLDVTGFVGHARLADALELPLDAVVADGDDLWLGTASGVRLWRDGWLHEVRVGAREPEGPFAVRDGLAWLAVADGLAGIEAHDGRWEVVASWSGARPDAIAVDADGEVYAAAGGSLVRYDGEAWREQVLPDAVLGVVAHADVAGAWALTADGPVRVDGDTLTSFPDAPVPDRASADEAGRLLLVADGALLRLSVDRGGVLVGVVDGEELEGPTDVVLLPTDAADVTGVEATLDGDPVEVRTDPWRVLVDPGSLGAGDHTLAARATWRDGAAADLRPVTFRAPIPRHVTWGEHIDPLRRDHCAVCHDGDTRTLLDSRERWQARVDDILTETTAQRMPLTGTKLTAAEIEMIRAWKDGGFP
jgi:hypothetical protein